MAIIIIAFDLRQGKGGTVYEKSGGNALNIHEMFVVVVGLEKGMCERTVLFGDFGTAAKKSFSNLQTFLADFLLLTLLPLARRL